MQFGVVRTLLVDDGADPKEMVRPLGGPSAGVIDRALTNLEGPSTARSQPHLMSVACLRIRTYVRLRTTGDQTARGRAS